MTGFDSEVEVKISIIFDYYLFVFDLIYKNVSKSDFTFFLFFNWINSSTKEYGMREYIANSFNIDAYRSISSHDIAVNIVVERLRCLGFEDDFYFCLSLCRNNSIHGLNNERI